MEVEKSAAGVADDAAGVIGPGDDLDRARERLVGHRVDLDGIGGRDRCFEDVDGRVHLCAVRFRRAPAVQLGSRPNEGEYVVRERAHSASVNRGVRISATSSMP